MPVATKVGKMVNYLKGFVAIKYHETLITCS